MQEISQWLTMSGQGNTDAFHRLYQRTSPQLYRVCLQLLDDPSKAEKVLELGFVQVWRRSGSYDPKRHEAMPWLLRTFQRAARLK